MKSITTFLLLTTSCFALSLNAQELNSNEASKNVFNFSLGSFVVHNSAHITYDRLIAKKAKSFFKSYYFTTKVGGNATLNFSDTNSGTGLLTSLGFTGLTGKGNDHLEIGVGLGYFFDSSTSDDFIEGGVDDSQFYPSISLGYRKQSPKGFVFRTGLGAAEWFYVGFGYSF